MQIVYLKKRKKSGYPGPRQAKFLVSAQRAIGVFFQKIKIGVRMTKLLIIEEIFQERTIENEFHNIYLFLKTYIYIIKKHTNYQFLMKPYTNSCLLMKKRKKSFKNKKYSLFFSCNMDKSHLKLCHQFPPYSPTLRKR